MINYFYIFLSYLWLTLRKHVTHILIIVLIHLFIKNLLLSISITVFNNVPIFNIAQEIQTWKIFQLF